MPAFTSILLGVSALSGVAGVSNAKKQADRQAAAQDRQSKAARTAAQEAASLESQDQGGQTADVVLGTATDADKLLKKNSTGKTRVAGASGVAGLSGASNIGGL